MKQTPIFFAIALIGGFIDIVTKTLVFGLLNYDFQTQTSRTIEIIPGVFGLRCLTNTGIIWGLFQGYQLWIFVVLWVLAVPLIIVMFFALKSSAPTNAGRTVIPTSNTIALGLILAGAIGNLYDRLFYHQVRDFLDFYLIGWPVFNLADAFITIGAILLIITHWRKEKKRETPG